MRAYLGNAGYRGKFKITGTSKRLYIIDKSKFESMAEAKQGQEKMDPE